MASQMTSQILSSMCIHNLYVHIASLPFGIRLETEKQYLSSTRQLQNYLTKYDYDFLDCNKTAP